MYVLELLEDLRVLVEAEMAAQEPADSQAERSLRAFMAGFDDTLFGDIDANVGSNPLAPAGEIDPGSIGSVSRVSSSLRSAADAAKRKNFAGAETWLNAASKQLTEVGRYVATAMAQWDRLFKTYAPPQVDSYGESDEYDPGYAEDLFAQSLDQLLTSFSDPKQGLEAALNAARQHMSYAFIRRDPQSAEHARQWLAWALADVRNVAKNIHGYVKAAAQYKQKSSGEIVGAGQQRRLPPQQAATATRQPDQNRQTQVTGQAQTGSGRVSPQKLAQLRQAASARLGRQVG